MSAVAVLHAFLLNAHAGPESAEPDLGVAAARGPVGELHLAHPGIKPAINAVVINVESLLTRQVPKL